MATFYRGTGALGSVGGRLNPFNYDFGLSEKIGGNVTAQGGSNLFGRNNQQNIASSNPKVLGATDTAPSVISTANTSNTSVLRPNTQTKPNVLTQSQVDFDLMKQNAQNGVPSASEIDSVYDPVLSGYSGDVSRLTQNRDSALSEAQRQYEINRSQLDNQRTGTLSQLGQQQMQAGTRRDDAIASARRLYNELMQANTQRFGGASSAGQAASELQGREFQRNIGDVKMEYESAVREIDQQRLSVDEQYNLGLQQLEVDKESALNSIRQQFADTISQINAQKGQVESAKASARLDALQELRNRIYQINTEAFNFQQQLNAQRTSAQSTLDQKAQEFETYINQGAGAVSGMDAPTTYNTTYGINNTTGGVNPGMVGQINPEDIYGALGANPNELGINYIPGMN